MADNDQTGVQLTVEDAQAFLNTMKAANDAVLAFADATTKAAKQVDNAGKAKGLDNLDDGAKKAKSSFTDLLRSASDLPVIGSAAGQAAGAVQGLGTAGAAAGTLMSSALGPVALVIAAITAAVGGTIAAFNAAKDTALDFVNTALQLNSAVDEIQDISGATAEQASLFAALGRKYEIGSGQISMIFGRLIDSQQQAKDSAEALGSAGVSSLAKWGKQTQRLKEDFDRNVIETTAQASERLDELRKTAEKITAKFHQSERERQDEFNASQLEAARELQQRLEDLQRDHAERITELNQSLVDAEADFAQDREDRESKLAEDLADLQGDFADERAKIEAKYYAPKSAREQAAKEEELALLDARQKIAEEELNKRAAKEEERARKEHEKKIAQLRARIEAENVEYNRQTERLKTEEARRAQIAQDRYNKETQSARTAYDEQVAANAEAQAKIEKDTEKRLKDMEAAYRRQLDDLRESMTTAGGASGGAAAKVDSFDKTLTKLGINLDEFRKKDAPGQFLDILNALGKMEAGAEKTAIAIDLVGPRMAGALIDMADEVASKGIDPLMAEFDALGVILNQDQKNALEEYRKQTALTQIAIDGFKTQIGIELLPVFREFLAELMKFWQEHGPQIIETLKLLIREWLPPFLELIRLIFAALGDFTKEVERDPFGTLGRQILNLLIPNGPFKTFLNTLLDIARVLGFIQNREFQMGALGIETTFYENITNPYDFYNGTYSTPPVPWTESVRPGASAQQISNSYANSSTSTTTLQIGDIIVQGGASGNTTGRQVMAGIADAARARGISIAGVN